MSFACGRCAKVFTRDKDLKTHNTAWQRNAALYFCSCGDDFGNVCSFTAHRNQCAKLGRKRPLVPSASTPQQPPRSTLSAPPTGDDWGGDEGAGASGSDAPMVSARGDGPAGDDENDAAALEDDVADDDDDGLDVDGLLGAARVAASDEYDEVVVHAAGEAGGGAAQIAAAESARAATAASQMSGLAFQFAFLDFAASLNLNKANEDRLLQLALLARAHSGAFPHKVPQIHAALRLYQTGAANTSLPHFTRTPVTADWLEPEVENVNDRINIVDGMELVFRDVVRTVHALARRFSEDLYKGGPVLRVDLCEPWTASVWERAARLTQPLPPLVVVVSSDKASAGGLNTKSTHHTVCVTLLNIPNRLRAGPEAFAAVAYVPVVEGAGLRAVAKTRARRALLQSALKRILESFSLSAPPTVRLDNVVFGVVIGGFLNDLEEHSTITGIHFSTKSKGICYNCGADKDQALGGTVAGNAPQLAPGHRLQSLLGVDLLRHRLFDALHVFDEGVARFFVDFLFKDKTALTESARNQVEAFLKHWSYPYADLLHLQRGVGAAALTSGRDIRSLIPWLPFALAACRGATHVGVVRRQTVAKLAAAASAGDGDDGRADSLTDERLLYLIRTAASLADVKAMMSLASYSDGALVALQLATRHLAELLETHCHRGGDGWRTPKVHLLVQHLVDSIKQYGAISCSQTTSAPEMLNKQAAADYRAAQSGSTAMPVRLARAAQVRDLAKSAIAAVTTGADDDDDNDDDNDLLSNGVHLVAKGRMGSREAWVAEATAIAMNANVVARVRSGGDFDFFNTLQCKLVENGAVVRRELVRASFLFYGAQRFDFVRVHLTTGGAVVGHVRAILMRAGAVHIVVHKLHEVRATDDVARSLQCRVFVHDDPTDDAVADISASSIAWIERLPLVANIGDMRPAELAGPQLVERRYFLNKWLFARQRGHTLAALGDDGRVVEMIEGWL